MTWRPWDEVPEGNVFLPEEAGKIKKTATLQMFESNCSIINWSIAKTESKVSGVELLEMSMRDQRSTPPTWARPRCC